jgi:hypothetical protein
LFPWSSSYQKHYRLSIDDRFRGASDLKIMCDKLEKVIQNTMGIDEVEQVFEFDNNANTRKWIHKLTNMPISSPCEIIGLKEIFRICHENKLQLYAYY